ncbi:MAG: Bug family tripartite tricarboxylate transporter substrate binding protein [Lautropia sp.]
MNPSRLMNPSRRRIATAAALLPLAAIHAPSAIAQDYPSRPVRWIVNYPPGGTTDVVARMVAQEVGQKLGVSIIIDNKAGAGGVIGMDAAAKAAPDGYTFLASDASLATAPSLYRKVPFDPEKDFRAIARFVTVPHVIVVNPKVAAATVAEFVALSRREPGKLNFSSGGIGSPLHLAGEVFRVASGASWTHVPYKGAGPAIVAVVAGEADVAAPSAPAALPQIAAGKLRALAVTSERRMASLPDVPTLAEAGVRDATVAGWIGLHAPAGVPDAAATKIEAAVLEVLSAPALREKLAQQGADLVAEPGKVYSQVITKEITRWQQVVKQAGITPE